MTRRWRAIVAAAAALALAGCECEPAPGADGGQEPMEDAFIPMASCDGSTLPECQPDPCEVDPSLPECQPVPTSVLPRPSRSTTIDIDRDNTIVAMVDPGDGSLSVFSTSDNERLSNIDTGAEPSSVVIHPDGTTAFVANQADATVVRIRDIDTGSPTRDGTVDVGSEPTGLALSPTGALLFVAEWAESRVSVIDTSTMSVTTTFPVRSPYAIAVTNDLDDDDSDESVVVPEFFGRPNAEGEVSNEGRTGFVQIRPLSSLSSEGGVSLAPIRTGFPDAASSDAAFANQLFGVTINGTRAFVTSLSAAPERPNGFGRTVHSVVYVIDLATNTILTDETHNLARLVEDNVPEGPARNHLADIVGLDFIANVAYVVSRGGDGVQRLDYGADPIGFGFPGVPQIDLNVQPAGETQRCQMPTGIVTTIGAGVGGTTRRAFVSCQITRQLGVIALSTQSLVALTESSQIPPGEAAVNRGRRFFFTGRGRWANESWSSCASCHPGGLTDGVTWRFGFGPRQSTSLDGSFSHPTDGAPVEHRVLNWTANFDEVHDFERNTRGTSGGKGAITSGDCSSLAAETRTDISTTAPAGAPMRELARQAGSCVPDDWDEVEAYMRTIRPPRARRGLDSGAIARGRTLFEQGCASCHGGGGWTVSERFWTPSAAENTRLTTASLSALPAFDSVLRHYTTHIGVQPAGFDAVADGIDDPATPPPDGRAPPHIGCAIRDVSTFGVRSADGTLNEALTAPLEQREGSVLGAPSRALGGAGFNVPSLYGLSLGAPFFHHGQAATLEEVLDPDGPFGAHVTAVNGDPAYLSTPGERADLLAFLLSIDATTPLVAVPAGFDLCSE